MKRMLSQLFSIARVTAVEGLQQPVCLLLTLTAVSLTVLQPLTQLNTFGESGRMARDCGLAFMLMFGIFVLAFAAGETLAAEIRRGTVAVALSKPLHRAVFLAGKFLGVAAIAAVFAWCVGFSVLFAERCSEHFIEEENAADYVRDTLCGGLALLAGPLALASAAALNRCKNFRFGLSFFASLATMQPLIMLAIGFYSRTGKYLGIEGYSSQIDWRILPAALLVFMLLLVFSSILTALATRLQSGAAAAAGFAILFAGFMSESQFGASTTLFGKFMYCLIPDVQNFWIIDALSNGGMIAWAYIANCAIYALLTITFILSLGHASLATRDIG